MVTSRPKISVALAIDVQRIVMSQSPSYRTLPLRVHAKMRPSSMRVVPDVVTTEPIRSSRVLSNRVDGVPAYDRTHHSDVLDVVWVRLVRVPVEHYKVGQLAGHD